MSIKKQNDVIQDITEQTLLTLDGVAEEISKQAIQEEVDNFIADRSLKDNQKEVMAIANKVAEYKKGDKTNFGVVVDVSASSITFKGKDLPKTKIVFNQRKMGSKDYVLSALTKMNESVYEDDQEMEEAKSQDAIQNKIDAVAKKLGLTDKQLDELHFNAKKVYSGSKTLPALLDVLNFIDGLDNEPIMKRTSMGYATSGQFGMLDLIINDRDEDPIDEEISWDLIQSMYVKDLIDLVIVPFAAAAGAFSVLGVVKAKDKIKDWLRDKKDDADANQLAKLIKDAIEKIKKDSTAQDMIAQINANPYDRNSNNTERNKLIKPYKAHLKSILSDEQYEILDDIYFASLKEEMKSNMENEKEEEMNENMKDWKSEYKDIAETIYSNLNRAKSARLFFGMFGQPGYLTRTLDEIKTVARKENVYLQNDAKFGMIESLMVAIRDQNDDAYVEEFFDEFKPQVQNLQAFLGKLNQHIDNLGKKRGVVEDEEQSNMTEAKFKKLTKDEFMKRLKKESVNEEDDDDEELSQEEEDAYQYSNQLIDAFNENEEMSIKDFKYYAYKFVHTMDSRSLLNVKSMSDKQLVSLVADVLDMDLELQGDTVIGGEKPSTIPKEADRNLWFKTIKLFKEKGFKNSKDKFLKLKGSIEKAMGHEDEGSKSSELLTKNGKYAFFYPLGGYDPDYNVIIGNETDGSAKLYHINDFVKNKELVSDILDEESDMKVDTTDIEELVSSEEGLTEGFKEKASIIFEAAVASKVKATRSLLKEQYATRLNEEVEIVKETLVEKIDSYLTYAVETWVADNKVAVESTLRTEITESFIGSLKSLFTEHYIEVPESKVDLFSNMETQVATLKEQVDKKGRIANALADRVEKLTRQKVIAEASSGLADTQIAKLTELVQDVEFINEDTFVKKVATIREFYINGRAANKNTLNENVDDNSSFISKETIVENTIEGDSISPSMQNYLSAMSRMNKATTANLVI